MIDDDLPVCSGRAVAPFKRVQRPVYKSAAVDAETDHEEQVLEVVDAGALHASYGLLVSRTQNLEDRSKCTFLCSEHSDHGVFAFA